MSGLTQIDRGVAQKHHAQDATASAQSLTDTERQNADGGEPTGMLISATTQDVTVTIDGTTPTATVGHNIATADPHIYIPGAKNIKNLQWIRSTGSNGVLQITLFY